MVKASKSRYAIVCFKIPSFGTMGEMGLPASKPELLALSPEDDRTVCFCHNRTCRELKEAIRAGAHTLKDVQDETQASTGCGGCEYEVREILEQEGYPQS